MTIVEGSYDISTALAAVPGAIGFGPVVSTLGGIMSGGIPIVSGIATAIADLGNASVPKKNRPNTTISTKRATTTTTTPTITSTTTTKTTTTTSTTTSVSWSTPTYSGCSHMLGNMVIVAELQNLPPDQKVWPELCRKTELKLDFLEKPVTTTNCSTENKRELGYFDVGRDIIDFPASEYCIEPEWGPESDLDEFDMEDSSLLKSNLTALNRSVQQDAPFPPDKYDYLTLTEIKNSINLLLRNKDLKLDYPAEVDNNRFVSDEHKQRLGYKKKGKPFLRYPFPYKGHGFRILYDWEGNGLAGIRPKPIDWMESKGKAPPAKLSWDQWLPTVWEHISTVTGGYDTKYISFSADLAYQVYKTAELKDKDTFVWAYLSGLPLTDTTNWGEQVKLRNSVGPGLKNTWGKTENSLPEETDAVTRMSWGWSEIVVEGSVGRDRIIASFKFFKEETNGQVKFEMTFGDGCHEYGQYELDCSGKIFEQVIPQR